MGEMTVLAGDESGTEASRSWRVRHDGWTPRRQQQFLEALARTGSVADACRAVAISTTSAYRARRLMPAFSRAWAQALDAARPSLEEAAYQRAVIGWEEPVFQGGKLVGHRRRYSDALLRLLLQRGFAAQDAPPKVEYVSDEELDAALCEKIAMVARLRRLPERDAPGISAGDSDRAVEARVSTLLDEDGVIDR